jgi:hypothetical protein
MADKMTFEYRRCPVIGGKAYASIEEGKKEFLKTLFVLESGMEWTPDGIAEHILENEAAILAVLTLSENSRPAARKALGAVRKSRQPKNGSTTPALPAMEDPFKA